MNTNRKNAAGNSEIIDIIIYPITIIRSVVDHPLICRKLKESLIKL